MDRGVGILDGTNVFIRDDSGANVEGGRGVGVGDSNTTMKKLWWVINSP